MDLNLITFHADLLSVVFFVTGALPVFAFMILLLGAAVLSFIDYRFGNSSSKSSVSSEDELDFKGKLFVGIFSTAFFVLILTGIVGYSVHNAPIQSKIRNENANVLVAAAAKTYGATLTAGEADKLLKGHVKDFDSTKRKYGTVNLSTPVDNGVVGVRLMHEGGKWLIYNTGTQKELTRTSS